MKWLIFILLSLVLVGLVSASGTILNMRSQNGGYYDFIYDFQLEKGWNLIAHGENFPEYMSKDYVGEELPIYLEIRSYWTSSGSQSAPLIAYVLDPVTRQYVEMFPNSNYDSRNHGNLGMWVYVNKPTRVKYFAPNVPPIDKVSFKSGWNMVSVTPELVGKTYDDFKGSCEFSKVYAYAEDREDKMAWLPLHQTMKGEAFTQSTVGYALAIRVPSDCTLGLTSDNEMSGPPALPGDSDNSNNNDNSFWMSSQISVVQNGNKLMISNNMPNTVLLSKMNVVGRSENLLNGEYTLSSGQAFGVAPNMNCGQIYQFSFSYMDKATNTYYTYEPSNSFYYGCN